MTISELAGTLKVPAQDLLALAKANGLEVSLLLIKTISSCRNYIIRFRQD